MRHVSLKKTDSEGFVFKMTLMKMYIIFITTVSIHRFIHKWNVDGLSRTKWNLFIQLCNSHKLFIVTGYILEWMCLCKPIWCMSCWLEVWSYLSMHSYCVLYGRAGKSCMFAVQFHTGLPKLAVWIHTHCSGCHHANVDQNYALRSRINIFNMNEICVFCSGRS